MYEWQKKKLIANCHDYIPLKLCLKHKSPPTLMRNIFNLIFKVILSLFFVYEENRNFCVYTRRFVTENVPHSYHRNHITTHLHFSGILTNNFQE